MYHRTLTYEGEDACKACQGRGETGLKKDGMWVHGTCPYCDGTGRTKKPSMKEKVITWLDQRRPYLVRATPAQVARDLGDPVHVVKKALDGLADEGLLTKRKALNCCECGDTICFMDFEEDDSVQKTCDECGHTNIECEEELFYETEKRG